ncbi:DUF1801 domain-containing protein [Streptomyces sp. NPDC056352]|uniref:DUF1801 domain-containing protein n=1 Tax=Streptomyces sp. NPDC056352 TaxID=3345791 RepID=UPI0035E1B3E1
MNSVQEYIDAIAPGHRSLFDRVSGLILEEFPQASVALSYGMPTYRVEERRLHIHGVSIYGWGTDRDGGFSSRHPTLISGKATVRLRSTDMAAVTDDELRALIRAALKV